LSPDDGSEVPALAGEGATTGSGRRVERVDGNEKPQVHLARLHAGVVARGATAGAPAADVAAANGP
jgi:hypothetical protein